MGDTPAGQVINEGGLAPRTLAESLYKTDPNQTWEQMI